MTAPGARSRESNEHWIARMVRVRVLNVRRIGRLEFVWRRGYFQLLRLESWGEVNARGDLGWTVHRPILTLGKEDP
mgnify:FL=1